MKQIRLTEEEKRYIYTCIANDYCCESDHYDEELGKVVKDDCDCNACLYQTKLVEKLKTAGW